MTPNADPTDLGRRRLLLTAGGGAAIAAGGFEAAIAGGPNGPPVSGLHLQFGADASAEIVVSWNSLVPVSAPRVLLGHLTGQLLQTTSARTANYVDAKSGQTVYVHHAHFSKLQPDHTYMYAAMHDAAHPEFGTFRTAPRGRKPLTFTSFGDQGTPTVARRGKGEGAPFVNDNLGSPAAGDTPMGVERVNPLFHLLNGDLCYANLAEDRVRSWWDFWSNNSRSARNRPWMPCAGNHENERGNGPIGYQAYQTFFDLPEAAGQTPITRGLWYAFTAGSVRVISLGNDDVCYQDGGDSYVRGYSKGEQKDWLEQELAAARRHPAVDWIVVCMHQVAISTADKFNGADLAIREEWLPLFDRYGVDLVVCGHEHHYERSHPLNGHEENATLTPTAVARATDVIDTAKGAVHMVLGGGGTSVPSNALFFSPPQCRVITGVSTPDPKTGRRASIYVTEAAPWSAVRNSAHAYGFAAFTVDPGTRPGGFTTMLVTYYNVTGPDGRLDPFERFVLRRLRGDRLV